MLTASDHQNAPKCEPLRNVDYPTILWLIRFCSFLSSRPVYHPVSPPQSPPFASLPASFESTRQASSGSNVSSSSLHRRASSQAGVSAQPDLSYISEGSQEPSLSLSQQEYRPYSSSDDEDGSHQRFSFNVPEGTAHAASHDDQYASYGRHAPFLTGSQDILAASYASSVEPDHVGQEIEENLLSASPKRPPPSQAFSLSSSPPRMDNERLGRSTSTSPSPTPTPTMPSFSNFPKLPQMPGAFLQHEPQTYLNEPEAPFNDDKQVGIITKDTGSKRRNARPSLLAQLGVSPGHLDISFGKPQLSAESDTTLPKRRNSRTRSISPSPLAEQALSEDEDSDSPKVATSSSSASQQRKTASSNDPDGLYLSKTVRHSNSATTLREKAKAAAVSAVLSDLPPVDASPANRVIARRRSNPTLSSKLDLSGSAKSSGDPSSSAGKTDRKRASTSSLEGTKAKAGSKIVQAMQSRPSTAPLVTLDGKTTTSSSGPAPALSKASGITISRPRSGSAVHRKLPSVSPTNTKNTISIEVEASPVAVIVSKYGDSPVTASSNVTARGGSRLTRSRSTSPEIEMNTSNNTSVLSDVTSLALPQASVRKASSSPSKSKDKGKQKEASPAVPPKPSRRDRESSPLTPYASQESASSAQNDTSVESMSAANISAREGRRARANVSYQEPSLNK